MIEKHYHETDVCNNSQNQSNMHKLAHVCLFDELIHSTLRKKYVGCITLKVDLATPLKHYLHN